MTRRRYPGVKRSTFGLPAKRKYPFNTRRRARAALSFISRYGTSAQKADVRRRVKHRWPTMQVAGRRARRRR